MIKDYRYEFVAVLDGLAIMTLELVGARMIAPYFGSTIFVWTAVIGVILGALSFGYWYGGRLADQGATDKKLVGIITMAAAVLALSLLLAPWSLSFAAEMGADLRLRAFVAAMLLFAPFNMLAGIVSPYLAKLRVTELSSAGSSVGQLYAAGTVGSILGTFITGYWLIGWLGSRTLAFGLILLLLGSTLILSRRELWWPRAALGLLAVGVMAWPHFASAVPQGFKVVYDGDSAYMRYLVAERPWGGRPARLLMTDNVGAQSGIYPDQPGEPVFSYIKRFMEVAAVKSEAKRVLLIGGGTYTLPRMLTERYPGMQVDVVEIDPKLDKLASQYFAFTPNDRIRIIHEDGRTFLNTNKQKYDIIYVDAFSSFTPPFTLTTTQAVTELSASLAPEGVVAVNLLSAASGHGAEFLRAEHSTYQSVMKYASLSPADAGLNGEVRQNVILLAANKQEAVDAAAGGLAVPRMADRVAAGMILTDNFAPVEHLLQR